MKSRFAPALLAYLPAVARRRLQARAEDASRTTEPELLVLEALSERHHAFLDVGANEGVYSAFLGPKTGALHLFEPVPQLAKGLQKLFPNATVHETALSNAAGSATLRIPVIDGRRVMTRSSVELQGQSESELEVTVKLSTLDSLAPESRLILKIDVEGHEMQVVHGGAYCISEQADVVLVESEERHAAGAPQAIIDWFKEAGFVGWIMLGHELIPASEFRISTHQSVADTAAVAAGGGRSSTYGNNFLFVREDRRAQTISKLTDAGFSIT